MGRNTACIGCTVRLRCMTEQWGCCNMAFVMNGYPASETENQQKLAYRMRNFARGL